VATPGTSPPSGSHPRLTKPVASRSEPMKPHLHPDFDQMSAAAWNAMVPGRNESVFSSMVYGLEDDVKQALMSGASLVPPGQTMGHALIYAVWGRHFGLLGMLLEHGFDPNALAWTAEGEISGTALDAVASCYHDGKGEIDEMVLDAMHALLREYGGKYESELRREEQIQHADMPTPAQAPSSESATRNPPAAWPDRLPDQVAILRQILATAEQLSARFGRRNAKCED